MKYISVILAGFLLMALTGAFFLAFSGCGDPLSIPTDSYGLNGTSPSPTNGSPAPGGATTLASGLRSPSSLAFYGDYVYWTDLYEGKIYRVPKIGGNIETMISSGLSNPIAIAIQNGFIYVGEGDPAQPGATVNSIKKMPVSGGVAASVLFNGQFPIGGFAVDGTNVYWTEHVLTVDSARTIGSVKWGSLDGTGPINTAISRVNKPGSLFVRNNFIYFIEEGTSPDGVTSAGDGTVRKVALNGSSGFTLVRNLNYPTAIAGDNLQVYFSLGEVLSGTTNLGSIKKSNQQIGGSIDILTGTGRITRMLFDPANFYLYYNESDGTNDTTGALKKIPLTGGTPVILASSLDSPGTMLTDDTYLYWIQADWSGGSGAILRISK
jgi:hypothetical protein